MKYYLSQNVYEAALDRLRFIFDEFPIVIVSISGGKDSTVLLNLALKIAEEKNRLPLKVMFIDQEGEWQTVIDYIREVFKDPRIKPMWFQMPIQINNATSSLNDWLYCWDEKNKEIWMREKEPNSIQKNVFGTQIWKHIFRAIQIKFFPYQKLCNLGGVRAEESPARLTILNREKYKGINYGKVNDKVHQHYTFYPLYDWSYTDIWKAIHDNNWPYCKIYDYFYQYGIPAKDMRVSNLHHETAHGMYYLQEIEPETWNKLVKRLGGINSMSHLGKKSLTCPKELPPMFRDWKEYRDHLLENLLLETSQKVFKKYFDYLDEEYQFFDNIEDLYRVQINAILSNDFEFTKIKNYFSTPDPMHYIRIRRKERKELKKNAKLNATNKKSN